MAKTRAQAAPAAAKKPAARKAAAKKTAVKNVAVKKAPKVAKNYKGWKVVEGKAVGAAIPSQALQLPSSATREPIGMFPLQE